MIDRERTVLPRNDKVGMIERKDPSFFPGMDAAGDGDRIRSSPVNLVFDMTPPGIWLLIA